MNKISLLFFTIIVLHLGAFAQNSDYSAPVKWENYKVPQQNITLALPKLPVKMDWQVLCSQLEHEDYWAYAREAVYQFRIYRKTSEQIPSYCTKKKKFSDRSFSERIAELEKSWGFGKPEKISLNGGEFVRLLRKNQNNESIVWLRNDKENDRWFEFEITSREGKNTNIGEQFPLSLRFSADAAAIEIKDGAEGVWGDGEIIKNTDDDSSNEIRSESNDKVYNFDIVTKPKPRYTEVARQANVTGDVVLKVTFLSNGGIGNISVVRGLSHGLNEQAIAAAKKIAFLPQKNSGKPITVIKSVYFSFSIY